ncbi:MAG: filamentous hemagglutinin N-terminal domain-containing protein, partial [Candidatus Omnitrophica bacterium]|nr:filamentous hemagglutinin N-terminal domain-containing protein [Candidatus Omnitrophota bacterium]
MRTLSHSKNEIIRARKTRATSGIMWAAGLIALFLLFSVNTVHALPEGCQVVEGTAEIDYSIPNSVTVRPSDNAVLNWQSLNITANESVYYYQTSANSNVLNNVIGGQQSVIAGYLYANGNIFIVNPNGIVFDPSANINVGSLVASTMNIDTEDFRNGRYVFQKLNKDGQIVNQAVIAVNDGGFIALLAQTIKNEGMLQADQGTVALASGNKVTISFENNRLIQVAIDEPVTSNPTNEEAAIINTGTIQADSGKVIIAASAARDAFANAVNNEGMILAAKIVENADGTIALLAPEGDIENSGTMYASGDITIEATKGEIVQLASAEVTGANISYSSLLDTTLAGTMEATASLTVATPANINITGNVYGLNGADLVFIADDDNLNGGDFTQLADAAISTQGGGDITIRSGTTAYSGTGSVTVANVSSSGDLDITAFGGEVRQIEGTKLAVLEGDLMVDAPLLTLYDMEAAEGHILIGSRVAPIQIAGLPHYIHTAGDIEINTVTSDAGITTMTTEHGDILRYATAGSITLEAPNGKVTNISDTAVPGDMVKLIGIQIGSIEEPFIVNANVTHIYRNISDIDIVAVIELEGDQVTIVGPVEGFGAVTYCSLKSLTLEAQNGGVTDSGQAIIPASTLTLIGNNIGHSEEPVITAAGTLKVVRTNEDIVIALSSIMGEGVTVRGPPGDDFAIQYLKSTNLILEAQDGSIYVARGVTISSNNLTLISTTQNLFLNGTLSTPTGDIVLKALNGTIYARGIMAANPDYGTIIFKADSLDIGGTYSASHLDFDPVNIWIDSPITAYAGALTFTATNDIYVNASVSASGTITFNADSDRDGNGSFIQGSATQITTTGTANIIIYAANATLDAITSAGSLSVYKSIISAIVGDITVNDTISCAGLIRLWANGNIDIKADVGSTGNYLYIQADYDLNGSGNLTFTAAGLVTLTAGASSVHKLWGANTFSVNGNTITTGGSTQNASLSGGNSLNIYATGDTAGAPIELTVTGTISKSGAVYLFSKGDIDIQADVSATGSSVGIYADYDANGSGNLTFTAVGIVTLTAEASSAHVLQGANTFSVNGNTITTAGSTQNASLSGGSGGLTITATGDTAGAPVELTVTGAISKTGAVNLRAYGDIDIQADVGSTGDTLYIQADYDANGSGNLTFTAAATVTLTAGASSLHYLQGANTFSVNGNTITTGGSTQNASLSGGNSLTIYATGDTVGAPVELTVTGAVSKSGTVYLYSKGDIDIQANVSSTGSSLYVQADIDANGSGNLTFTAAATVTLTAGASSTHYLQGANTFSINGNTITTAGSTQNASLSGGNSLQIYTTGDTAGAPVELTVTGAISKSGIVTLWSRGDIDIQADVGSTGNYLYIQADYDANGSGNLTFTAAATVTLTAGASNIHYLQGANTFSVNGNTITTAGSTQNASLSGGNSLNIYATGDTAGAPVELTVTGAISKSGVVYLFSKGDIDIQANVGSTESYLYIQADYNANGSGNLTFTAAGLVTLTAGTGNPLTLQGANTFIINGNTITTGGSTQNASLSGGATTTIYATGDTAGAPVELTVTGAFSRSGNIFLYSNGDIDIQANVSSTGSSIAIQADYDANGSGNFTHTSGTISTTTASNITIKGYDISLGSISAFSGANFIYVTATNNITSNSASFSADAIVLKSTSGSVGTASTPIPIATGVYVETNTPLGASHISKASGNLDIKTAVESGTTEELAIVSNTATYGGVLENTGDNLLYKTLGDLTLAAAAGNITHSGGASNIIKAANLKLTAGGATGGLGTDVANLYIAPSTALTGVVAGSGGAYINSNGNTLTIAGNLTVTSGALQINTGAGALIQSSGTISTVTSGDITLTSEGVSSTLQAVTSAGALTLAKTTTAATYTVGVYTIGVSGNLTINSGVTLTCSGATLINVGGNWDSSAGTFTYGTSEVIMTATGGNKTITTPTSGSYWDVKFYKLTINSGINKVSWNTGTSAYPSYALNITGELEIGTGKRLYVGQTGTLTINNASTLSGAGRFSKDVSNASSNIVNNGTISVSLFEYLIGQGATTAPITPTTYGGNLTITNSNAGSATGVLGIGTLTVGGNLTITHTTVGAVTITLNNSVNNTPINVGGNWDSGTRGVYTKGASETVTFTASAVGKTITTGGSTFNTVVFDSSNAAGGWTLVDALTCTGITVTDGTLIDGGQTVTVNGNISIANTSGILTSTGTWIQGANGNISNPNSGNIIAVLQIGNSVTSTRTGGVFTKKLVLGTSAVLTGASTIAIYPNANDFLDMGAGSSITTGGIDIVPSATPLTQKAFSTSVQVKIAYANTKTIQMTGNWTTGTLWIAGDFLADTEAEAQVLDTNGFNLTVNGNLDLGISYAPYPEGYRGKILFKTGTHSITGNVNVDGSSGYTYGYFDFGTTSNVSIGGNVDFTRATVTPGSSTVILNGTGTQNITSNSQSFYGLTINKSAGSAVLIDALDVNGNFRLQSGTFNANSQTQNYAGNFQLDLGTTFTKGGAVTFDGITVATYTDSTATPQNIGIVSINKTDTVAPATNNKLTLASSMTVDTLTIDGTAGSADTLDLGAGGYTLTLANAGATATVLTVSGTLTPGTSTVKYSATNSAGNINVTTTTYNSLQLSGTETYDLTGNLTVGNALTGNLTIDAGAILDTTLANSYGITLAGNFVQSSITSRFNANSSTITINGNGTFTADGTVASTQYNSATLVLNGVNTLTYNNLSGYSANGFNNLTAGQSGNTTTLGSHIAIGSILTIGSGTLTGSKWIYLKGANPLSFDVNSSLTLTMLSFVASATIPTLTNGYNCGIVTGGNVTITQTGNVTLNGTNSLSITAYSAGNVITWKTDGYNLTVGGNLTIGFNDETGLRKLDATRNVGAGRTSTITVGGNWLNYGTGTAPSQFIADDSTVIFNKASGTQTLTSGTTNSSFYNLTHSGAGTLQLADALSVTGAFINSVGIFDANTMTVTVTGLTSINGGTYSASTALQTFNGGLTIGGGTFTSGAAGSVDVNGAFALNSGTFTQATSTLNVSGNFTIADGSTFTKATGGQALTLDGATQNISDANATTNDIGVVVTSGTGTTTMIGNLKLTSLSIGTGTTFNLGTTSYILTITGTGTPLVATGTFNKGTGSTVIYTGTATATNIARVAYNNLTLTPTGATTYNLTGDLIGSYAMTGNLTINSNATLDVKPTSTEYGLTAVDITINGTLDATSSYAPITASGNWTNSGTFTAGTSTVTLTGNASAHQTITTAGQAFYNLTLNNTQATYDQAIISGALDVNGTLTITDGTLNLLTNNPNVNTAGNVSIASAGAVTKGTGTWTFDGTTAATYTDSTATPQNIGVVSINKTDTVAPATNNKLTLASSMTVDTLTIDGTVGSADILDLGAGSYTLTLANAGATATVLTVSGTLTPGTSTVKYSATNSAGNINVTTTTYNSLQLSGTETYDLTGNLTVGNALTGNLTIDTGATLDIAGYDFAFSIARAVSNSGTFRLKGIETFTNVNNLDIDSGTVTYYGRNIAESLTIKDFGVGADYYNLTINDTNTNKATYVLGAALDVDGTFRLQSGTFNANSQTQNYAGNFQIDAGTTFTKGGAITFDGTTAATYTDLTAATQNIGIVTLNKTDTVLPGTNNKLTLASSMKVDTLTIDGTAGSADTLDLGAGGYTLTLANAGATATVLTVAGTLTPGTSIVKYSATNSAGNINVATTTYNSLQLSGAETYDLTGNLTAGNALTGNLTIDTGATLDTTLANSYGVTLAGQWSNSGTFTARSNTVTFNGTAQQSITTGGVGAGKLFNNLTLNNTGPDGTINDDIIIFGNLDVDGTFTITNGQLQLSSYNPNVNTAGSVSIASAGAVTKGTGTWTFDGTTATTYTDSTATPQNIGIVSINKTDTVAPATNNKLTLASSMTVDTLTIDGTVGSPDTLDLGAGSYTLTLANAGATATVLTVSGTLTPGTSTVKYSAT